MGPKYVVVFFVHLPQILRKNYGSYYGSHTLKVSTDTRIPASRTSFHAQHTSTRGALCVSTFIIIKAVDQSVLLMNEINLGASFVDNSTSKKVRLRPAITWIQILNIRPLDRFYKQTACVIHGFEKNKVLTYKSFTGTKRRAAGSSVLEKISR